MNQDSLLLKVVAEQIEKQKLQEAEKLKSYTNWLGTSSFLFIENFFSPFKAKKSQREHEAILNKYRSVKTNPS